VVKGGNKWKGEEVKKKKCSGDTAIEAWIASAG
jgi:hypothetical protein